MADIVPITIERRERHNKDHYAQALQDMPGDQQEAHLRIWGAVFGEDFLGESGDDPDNAA